MKIPTADAQNDNCLASDACSDQIRNSEWLAGVVMKYDLATKIQRKSKGRFDALRQAFTDQDLEQPGLMDAVVGAVTDGSPEFADFVADKVLPAYGTKVVPHLAASFDPLGKMPDARRLRAVKLIDRNEAMKLARQAIHGRHPDLVSEALSTLAGSQADESLLLQQASIRKGDLRRDAYIALKGVQSTSAVEAVCKAFQAGVFDASEAMNGTPDSRYTAFIVDTLQRLTLDHPDLRETKNSVLLAALYGCTGRGGSDVDQVLASWLQIISEKVGRGSWVPIRCQLMEAIAIGSVPNSQRLFVAGRDNICPNYQMIFPMCAASWHEDYNLFELFSPYLFLKSRQSRCGGWSCGCGGGSWSCSLLSSIEFVLDVDFEAPGYEGVKPLPTQRKLIDRIRADSRWIDARVKAIQIERESRLAR